MKGFLLYLFIILRISVPFGLNTDNTITDVIARLSPEPTGGIISPMEALDMVKKRYAANFEKVTTGTEDQYYYKLSLADYYLEYEGEEQGGNRYLIHLYEFVSDEPESDTYHTVTYGWYTVDEKSGAITEKTE